MFTRAPGIQIRWKFHNFLKYGIFFIFGNINSVHFYLMKIVCQFFTENSLGRPDLRSVEINLDT